MFDVSLDFLVFGEESASAATGEAGYLAAQVETGLREAQVRSAALHDLVARIGAQLGRQIEETARTLLPQAVGLGGSLSADELARLESHSARTRIANCDFDLDIVEVRTHDQVHTAAGPIAPVIVDNIRRGKTYEYVLPDDPDMSQKARLFRQLIGREAAGVSAADLDRRLQIYLAPHGCLPGFLVYQIDIRSLDDGDRELYNRVSSFFWLDRENAGFAFVGVAMPASRSMQNYILTASRNTAKLISEHDWLKNSAHKLAIRATRGANDAGAAASDGETE